MFNNQDLKAILYYLGFIVIVYIGLKVTSLGSKSIYITADEEFIKKEFKKREIRQYITIFSMLFIYPFLIFILSGFEKHFDKTPKILSFGVIAVVSAPIIYSFFNWRCPKCGNLLGRRLFPKSCSMCGSKLS